MCKIEYTLQIQFYYELASKLAQRQAFQDYFVTSTA